MADEMDGYTLRRAGGLLNLAMDHEWKDDVPILLPGHKDFTMEWKIDSPSTEVFDLLMGRTKPKHAAESSVVNNIQEVLYQVRARWPLSTGKHIEPGHWQIVVLTWKDKPTVQRWTWIPTEGKHIMYTINMDWVAPAT
jgi:hypothetical protein